MSSPEREMPGAQRECAIFYPHIGEYGGIERNVVALAEAVLSQGHIPRLICFYADVDMCSYVPALRVTVLAPGQGRLARLKALRKWYAGQQGMSRGVPFFFGARAGHYAALARLAGYVLHYTDPPSLLSGPSDVSWHAAARAMPRNWLAHRILRSGVWRALTCITMTQANAGELQQLYGRPFLVTYQGGLAPVKSTFHRRRCLGKTITLLSICRLNPSKNLDWILRAASTLMVQSEFNSGLLKLRVVIAGGGAAADQLRRLSAHLQLSSVVELPGFVAQDQIEGLYDLADIFLVPGRQGYGLPVLEALYRNIPVVLSRESRVSEILMDHPLAAISNHSAEAFCGAVSRHLDFMRQETAPLTNMHALPTEREWGLSIGRSCNWW